MSGQRVLDAFGDRQAEKIVRRCDGDGQADFHDASVGLSNSMLGLPTTSLFGFSTSALPLPSGFNNVR